MMQDATLTTTARISAELNDKYHDVALTETARLAMLAREGLRQVAAGETKAMDGWLVYGAALNKGRELFANGGQGDKDFGAWIVGHQLDGPNDMERLAAMWTATNPNDFEATRKANPRVRTVRGIHAKWKEDQKGGKPKPVQRRAATIDDLRRVERLRALRDDPAASEGERVNAQSKLDAIEKEVGPVEPQKVKPVRGRTTGPTHFDWRMRGWTVDRVAFRLAHKLANSDGEQALKIFRRIVRRAYKDEDQALWKLLEEVEGL